MNDLQKDNEMHSSNSLYQ